MAAPSVRSVGAIAGAPGAISVGLPAGHTTNDILLLYVETADLIVTPPTGYAHVPDSPQEAGGVTATNTILSVLWKRDNGSETDPTVADTGNHQMARIIAVEGCITTGDPWDVTSGSTDAAATTAVSIPGDTTTVADTLCLAAASQNLPDTDTTNEFGSATNADLTSLTTQINNTSSAGNGGGLWVVSGVRAAAGTVGATTCTSVTDPDRRSYHFIALKPPSGGTQSLTGSLFTKAPTFFTGAITAIRALTGSLFSKAPTFFTGTVTATRTLTGTLFTKAPTFPTGAVSLAAGPQTVNGVLFTKAPTFPQGVVTSTYALTGTLFVKAPTFFTGTVTAGAVTLTGTLFVKAPTFPQGTVTAGTVSLTGTLFQKAPTFPTGTVATTYTLNGILFVKAPTFPQGTIGQAGTLFGTLFVKAPTFFTGSLAQGAPSFWQPDPAGWTANPAAFVRVGRYGPSPWGAELSGQRFEKAPTFPVGTVT